MRRSLGFTLIEVLVAFTVAGIVKLLARGGYRGVLDGATRMTDERAALDREANAQRILSEAFGSFEVCNEMGGFVGRPDRVEFIAAQMTAKGWLAPRRVILAQFTDTLAAVGDGGERLNIETGISSLRFDYLLEPGANTRWVREWISPVSAPLVVRMRVTLRERVDTLLF